MTTRRVAWAATGLLALLSACGAPTAPPSSPPSPSPRTAPTATIDSPDNRTPDPPRTDLDRRGEPPAPALRRLR